jgi:hypothetical protein
MLVRVNYTLDRESIKTFREASRRQGLTVSAFLRTLAREIRGRAREGGR